MKYVITLGNQKYEVEVNQSEAVLTAVTEVAPVTAAPQPASQPTQPAATAPQAASSPQAQAAGTALVAPMPGNILAVNAAVGDSVKAGQVLVILEAMKMENEIAAPQDGVVKQILVQKGASVNTDDVLLVL
ncbi:MAG: biotin/lipoyl-binding protein [Oscillospiraceae bacterium]|jgi:glutaconyl-CoA decarboxylase|nr:biotin/lipoyl-binding protein [Oscillospiraceae bacterium]